MRKYSLRQAANRYLKTDNRGNFKDKKRRGSIIHKIIDDLYLLGEAPPAWQSLTVHHVHKLVTYWRKQGLKPASIMRYMTIIRLFLKNINCELTGIDNSSLGLKRPSYHPKKLKLSDDIWQKLSNPAAQILMALQALFGLTLSEAMRFIPDIHKKDHALWITREIAFNSVDRFIPIRHKIQESILAELIKYTQGNKNLTQYYSSKELSYLWDKALKSKKLPVNRCYRYLYARRLYKELMPKLGNYQTQWIIREEMGIKSRNTLWLYLNE